jgi:glycine/D-amino acid oxidase-like deaminating enzyme
MIIGGGIVGSAIALGLAERGQRVIVLDEGDRAHRAARANFGLVWLQSKGDGMPAYMRWTRRSTDLWPELSRRLLDMTGINVEYRKKGGVYFCLSDTEFETRRRKVAHMRSQADVFDTEMLNRAALEGLMPGVRFGRSVVGASFCPHDGDANPLRLLQALHTALDRLGVDHRVESPVMEISHRGGCFIARTPQGQIEAARVVVAAGHGSARLAEALGLPAPIRTERGQIIVTERVRPFLPLPASGIRQTADGTVLIGSSKENVGFDDRTTVAVGARMADRALQVLPELSTQRINRTWSGFRVLTPDNHPVYAESQRHPGAFVALCHSGVTLAAAHAGDFAEAIAQGRLGGFLDQFHAERFDVRSAA